MGQVCCGTREESDSNGMEVERLQLNFSPERKLSHFFVKDEVVAKNILKAIRMLEKQKSRPVYFVEIF